MFALWPGISSYVTPVLAKHISIVKNQITSEMI